MPITSDNVDQNVGVSDAQPELFGIRTSTTPTVVCHWYQMKRDQVPAVQWYSRVCVDNNRARPTAAPGDGKPAINGNSGGGGDDGSTVAADFGEAIYTAMCEELRINRVQRVIDGLSTASLNLKYRCLGPLGAKALAAALTVSIP